MSTDGNVCDHCRKTFASKKGLDRHQLTAKYCARIRNITVSPRFQCPYCNYGTCFKSDLNKHIGKCETKNKDHLNEKELERLKNELLIREAKIEILEKMAERPQFSINNMNNTNMNNVNNTNNTNITLNTLINHSMKVLSPYEELLRQLPQLIEKHVTYGKYKKDIDGITSALIDGILRNDEEKWIVCYEGSKQDFHEKKLGQIKIDQRASDFFKDFLCLLKPKINEFSSREFNEAESDESERKAIDRKKLFLSLDNESSPERKRCVKNLAESIFLSKNTIRMHDQCDNSNIKITTKMKRNFILQNLSEYFSLRPLFSRKMEKEFTFEKYILGIPGLVETAKNLLTFEGKISVAFFESEPDTVQILVENEPRSMPVNDLIKHVLVPSINRLSEIHHDSYTEKYQNEEKSESLRITFKNLGKSEFSEDKELSSERREFTDLLLESLKVSDDEIRAASLLQNF